MLKINKSKWILTVSLVCIAVLHFYGCEEKKIFYEPSWESLEQHKAVPDWFFEGKFGIYFHWGVESVPSFQNEWYARNMYTEGSKAYKHHIETWGDPSEFGYKEFIPMYTAEKFDADEWAQLFKDAGATFAGPVAQHHDGFAQWDSEVNRWNAMDMGPKRDISGEITRAIRKQGLKVVATFHHAQTRQWFPRNYKYDTTDPDYADLYGYMDKYTFEQRWKAILIEYIDKYQPDLMWFDFGLGSIDEQRKMEYLAYYFNQAQEWGHEVGVTYKMNHLPQTVGILDFERGRANKITPFKWLTDTSIDLLSWAYISEPDYKSIQRLLWELIDSVSKNGHLLLSIAPRFDGTIPEPQKERLLGMGEWLKVNGETIYGTKPWVIFGEGPTDEQSGSFSEGIFQGYTNKDIRFTEKGNDLYATFLGWPEETAVITTLGLNNYRGQLEIANIKMLGSDEVLTWSITNQGLQISVPDIKPAEHAFVYKISFVEQTAAIILDDLSYDVSPRDIVASIQTINHINGLSDTKIMLRVDGIVQDSSNINLSKDQQTSLKFKYSFTHIEDGLHIIEIGNDDLGFLKDKIETPRYGLGNQWKFKAGDNPAWSDPDLDDSDWQRVKLPGSWEDHSNYHEDNVFGWFRIRFLCSPEMADSELILKLGKIDDVDIAFVNGVQIGASGKMPPDFKTAWNQERNYSIPEHLLKPNQVNHIAVRVFDGLGGGGLTRGPIEIVKK